MRIPELSIRTSAAVELVPKLGHDAANLFVVVIKQRFGIGRLGAVAPIPGAQVRHVDEPWDEGTPEKSSVKFPADTCLRKPSTDVVVVGCAMARGNMPARQLDVLLSVGPLQRQLRVHGPRVWYKGLTGLALGPAQPVEAVPLRWEYAFGGMDMSDLKKPAMEPRNPFGRGMACDSSTLIHQPAPQIEDPRDPVQNHRSRPTPAGVAPIPPHVLPRIKYAGTYDDRWQKERMPLPPLDFDERHNQIAPPELIAPSYFRGGETVQLVNLCADGPLQFHLPKKFFGVAARADSTGRQEYRPVLDTVLLQPNERAFELTWRVAVPEVRPEGKLRAVDVYEKELV
jgi:hypothetical protein